MIKVLLINQEKIPLYRISVYNYLSAYLQRFNYSLTVVSDGALGESTIKSQFNNKEIHLSVIRLGKFIIDTDPDIVIYWVRLRHLYLFPILVLLHFLGKKTIYWGHGSDWSRKKAITLKIFANNIEYLMTDALILYAEHQKRYVKSQFHKKVFVANNTLCFDNYQIRNGNKLECLSKYNISTSRNIICMGRMQKRKRLEDLFRAFELIQQQDVGLILVGPDTDGILQNLRSDKIYKLGPIYGNERLDLLASADVFCLPGAVGLSIVDAFYCGLPLVTDDGDESPEIMYLKDGINGFVVPRGDVQQLAARLDLLLRDDDLREQFSREARKEIATNGHIDTMCRGFLQALQFVNGNSGNP
jgi:glycosyltransferase involved in cell wall biosynthesis